MEFRAKVAKMGEDKIIIVPNCYKQEFPHRGTVEVKLLQ
jgi:hypothetical protein